MTVAAKGHRAKLFFKKKKFREILKNYFSFQNMRKRAI